MSISVESKAYEKRWYYQSLSESWSESLSHSSSESSLESSESLSRCPSPQKNMEVAVNKIMLVLNKQAITEVKVILQLTKMRKISIGVSMKKNAKADRGVDPLMNIEEGKTIKIKITRKEKIQEKLVTLCQNSI